MITMNGFIVVVGINCRECKYIIVLWLVDEGSNWVARRHKIGSRICSSIYTTRASSSETSTTGEYELSVRRCCCCCWMGWVEAAEEAEARRSEGPLERFCCRRGRSFTRESPPSRQTPQRRAAEPRPWQFRGVGDADICACIHYRGARRTDCGHTRTRVRQTDRQHAYSIGVSRPRRVKDKRHDEVNSFFHLYIVTSTYFFMWKHI